MHLIRFDYKQTHGYRGLILHRYPIKLRGSDSTKKIWLLAICAEFEVKDDLKEFCKKRGGDWCPAPGKFWWIPLNLKWDKSTEHAEAIASIWRACKEVIDEFGNSIRMGGIINLAIEADVDEEAEKFFQLKLLEQVEMENARLQLQNQWEEMPKLFNIKWVSDVDDENSYEYRGDEGHWEGEAHLTNGKVQKVEVFKDKDPSLEEIERQLRLYEEYGEYRQFLAEDGNTYYCIPIISVSTYDFGMWDDIDFSEKPVVLPAIATDVVVGESYIPPKPKVIEIKPDMLVQLVLDKKTSEPLAFRVKFDNTEGFRLLPLFKRLISERVYGNKYWDVPLECAEELKSFVKEYSVPNNVRSGYKIEVSSAVQQLFDQGDK